MDRAKKQVEQVWVTPSYDVSDSGVCDGVIKHNSAARSSTWVSSTMGGKEKKLIQGTYSPGGATMSLLGYRLIRMCVVFFLPETC